MFSLSHTKNKKSQKIVLGFSFVSGNVNKGWNVEKQEDENIMRSK